MRLPCAASRILARWKSYLGISYATASMVKFAVTTFFMVHLMSCAWAYTGLNWMPSPGVTLAWERPWIDVYEFSDVTTTRLYVISLYVAVVAMFGGVSNLTPCNCTRSRASGMMCVCGAVSDSRTCSRPDWQTWST